MKIIGYKIPDNLRYDFSQPRGVLINGEIKNYINMKNWEKVICVGDVVSSYCLKANRLPDFIIIDGKTRRTEGGLKLEDIDKIKQHYEIIKVLNPAGIIGMDSYEIICKIVNENNKKIIFVNGEEDMLTMPCLSCAPLNSLIIYGIPNKGAALVNLSIYIKRDLQQKPLSLKPTIFDFQ
ncbi:MAG: GTP-dependent dephospho-CoA kinase family protein [Caldisphaera sp.]|jgi:uncharacterized protein (UPF0218 family)|nr:GTP-dependent dephospho-CoA kinase family protein [Caldisphaera sp.]PMP60963.1 MAG: hypothetical protein C0201_01210 [Caldisphaera sp.]